jgi:hypothetical protein
MSHHQTGERRSRRYQCTHRVQFFPLSSIDKHVNDRARQALLLNISKDGVGMRVKEESLDVGSLITLRIPASVRTVTVPVLTEVRWVEKETPKSCQVGLRFLM